MFEPTDTNAPIDPTSVTDSSPPDERDLAIGRLVAAFGGGELVRSRPASHHPLSAA